MKKLHEVRLNKVTEVTQITGVTMKTGIKCTMWQWVGDGFISSDVVLFGELALDGRPPETHLLIRDEHGRFVPIKMGSAYFEMEDEDMGKERISFNFESLQWDGITVGQVKMWEQAYPLCDVVDILTQKMVAWLDANPQKAKQYKNWKRFIVNWLARSQERYEQFKR